MQRTIERRELLSIDLGKKTVTSVEVREIVFEPSQQTGRHKHPCQVMGYIAEGSAVLQVEGGPPQLLPAGSAFHEPANAVIARFDNASDVHSLRFIAYYLLEGDQALIEMLN